jgi:hypothetical protein
MAEQDQAPLGKGKKEKIAFDQDELQAFVNKAVTEALTLQAAQGPTPGTADLAKAIVDGLKEVRKPYVDPKQKALEVVTRKQMREQQEKQRAEFLAAQQFCEHKQGSNPLGWYNDPNKSSFAVHRLDTGEWIGICTNCTKVISSLLPEDREFFRHIRGTNIKSAAGERVFTDPLKVQRARLGLDQKEIYVDDDGNIVPEPVAK